MAVDPARCAAAVVAGAQSTQLQRWQEYRTNIGRGYAAALAHRDGEEEAHEYAEASKDQRWDRRALASVLPSQDLWEHPFRRHRLRERFIMHV